MTRNVPRRCNCVRCNCTYVDAYTPPVFAFAYLQAKHPQCMAMALARACTQRGCRPQPRAQKACVPMSDAALACFQALSNIQQFCKSTPHTMLLWETLLLSCRLGPCSKAVMDAVLSSDDPTCGGALTWSDSLILAVLEREHMLVRANIRELSFERSTKETHVFHLRRLINLVGFRGKSSGCRCCALGCDRPSPTAAEAPAVSSHAMNFSVPWCLCVLCLQYALQRAPSSALMLTEQGRAACW